MDFVVERKRAMHNRIEPRVPDDRKDLALTGWLAEVSTLARDRAESLEALRRSTVPGAIPYLAELSTEEMSKSGGRRTKKHAAEDRQDEQH